MLRRSFTAVLEKNATFTESFHTAPYEVAWAGEAQSQPRRLGWWRTDLVDQDGGAGLLHDLLPQTWRWASLEAVR